MRIRQCASRSTAVVLLLAGVVGLTACGTGSRAGIAAAPSPAAMQSTTASPSATPARIPVPSTALKTPRTAGEIVAAMSTAERAGAVLMTAGTVDELRGLAPLVRRHHLAGVMVRGRSAVGAAAVRRALGPVRRAAPAGLPLLISTDQEGGYVQVLRGAGFGTMPSALRQAHWSSSELRHRARGWGAAMRAAGLTMNLAPVADTPCAATAYDNPPIADLDRDYGSDPASAARHVAAVVRGMRAARIATTVKHFPGLGCVRENTDTAAHVVDRSISATHPRLQPFRTGIGAGAGFVMVSSATYLRIDPHHPALFSRTVIRDLLRGRLHFAGVVMTDDVGGAAALKPWSRGQRAVEFVAAGGDLVLDIVPADAGPMASALTARARRDRAFAARLGDAATRVVQARLDAR